MSKRRRKIGRGKSCGGKGFQSWMLKLLIITLMLVGGRSEASELHWQNGEWVGGHFVGMEAGRVIWRTPMFSEDFEVGLEVLKRVNRFKTDAATEEPFSICLADGSRLYGAITGLDEKTLNVKSARWGSIEVLRETVVSVQRLKAKGMPLAALGGTHGWNEMMDDRNTTPKVKLWRAVPGAALQQVGWNRRVNLPVEAPEKVEMQFTLSSSVRPEFKVELKAPDEEGVIVETWMDEVVMQGQVFESLQKLNDDTRRITLILCWDRKTGRCAIYGADGRQLAEMTRAPKEATEGEGETKDVEKKSVAGAGGGGLFGALFGVVQDVAKAQMEVLTQVQPRKDVSDVKTPLHGFTLLNKGPDLTLEALCIREWDGTAPRGITDTRPRVELTDGHALQAQAVRADASALTVREPSGKETRLPWEQVLAVEMVKTVSPFFQAAPPLTEMWFTDGEWVNGTLLEVRNETATFQTTFSKAPVNFKITALHHLEFQGFGSAATKVGLAKYDMLKMNKSVLHGTLEAGGEAQPRWKPVGAIKPVALVSAGEMEITRAVTGKTAGMRSEALFYLQDGDVVPGRLRAIDAKQVDLESEVAAVKHLPTDKLQAIQFGGASLNLDGFEDPGWQRVRGSAEQVKRQGKGGIDFEPGGAWGHPAFMQVNEIKFTLQDNGFCALRMRLYCEGVNRGAPSTNLLFGHMGSEVCFGLEATGEQMDRQFRLHASGPIPIRIALGENWVEVFFNGVSARRIVLNPKMCSGSGIIIEPFSLWGNGEREVKINAFSARVAPGRVAVPIVDAQAKEHALTVPRFRKDDPPRQALLAANGDLLRGVIEAATADHFSIRSGLETVQVPRERVKAAVWLVKPADVLSAAFEARDRVGAPAVITHWLLLNNGGRLGLKVARFAEDAVFGSNPLLGECRVPLAEIHGIRSTVPPESATMLALRDWRLKYAPEPVLPEAGGQSSPLLNQEAKVFKLPLLAGGEFDLAKEKGKVIVLDFWATWCGPCIKSLPQMMNEMAGFDPKRVRFIGVNQAEAKETVQTFLKTRGWAFEVALDADQRVGQSFGVEGIPHTVVIGPDGKVAYVTTGYEPEGAKKIAEKVRKLVGE
jgi:thiol-disulfide isomerase/thioredoxin